MSTLGFLTDTRSTLPERIPLQTKLTKRCPDGACRHLLIQPDSKSTRFKIKMVATNYLPEVELGRRRRRLISGDLDQPMTQEEIDRRRRERRKTRAKGDEEDEEIGLKLIPGHIVSTGFDTLKETDSSTRTKWLSPTRCMIPYRFV